MKNTTVGVYLATDIIQVCVFYQNKITSNTEMSANEFTLWLVKAKPFRIVFEACGTSNHWKQKAIALGHKALLISAKLVNTVRQNQKNDALAIVQASLLPDIKFIEGKNIHQQQL